MKGSLVIASTHATVNKHNVIGLQQLHTELFILEAINSHSNIPNFKPKINPKKLTVESTAYVQTLKVREGCRVMLIANIDVQDSLCNGSIGTVRHILKDKNEDVKVILVEFDNINSGRELQRRHPNYAKMFPGCTPILRQAHKYTTSKNSKGAKSNTATVFQFPLILAFSSTTHKIQGLTVYSPRKVSVDLRSVFGPHQAYVMLGRVQGRDDLYIIEDMPEEKIKTDKEALKQLSIMKERSLNNNPPVWEKSLNDSVKILYHNIHSLRDKMDDVKADLTIPFGDLIIFSETWLEEIEYGHQSEQALSHINNENPSQFAIALSHYINKHPYLSIDGYQIHLNSKGRGKGLALYIKEQKFSVILDIADEDLQLTSLESENLTVVCLYRSNADKTLAMHLKKIIPAIGTCLIIGDFNICSKKQPNHEVFRELQSMGFNCLVEEATHYNGGHIDQAWIRSSTGVHNLDLYSPYYNCKDHDALLFTYYNPEKETGKLSKIFKNCVSLGCEITRT